MPVGKTPFVDGQKPCTGAGVRICKYRYEQKGFFHLLVELENFKK